MKRLLFVFLIFITAFIYSEEIEKEVIIFEKYEESVVYIYQALYLNSRSVSHPELFDKIEKKYGIEILDTYFTISSGTGFLITSDGYLLTNSHVVEHGDLTELKENLISESDKNFFSKIPRSLISYDEYQLLSDDLEKLFNDSVFNYVVLVNNETEYKSELCDNDTDLDLALLKVTETETFNAIPLGDSDLLKVGNFIMAIGYPVPSSLFYAVKDFKSTMTSGKISALRSDNWGIQHTSSISPGNSGGPLFNKNGEVIGINVGAVTTGNDLFFSIPINKMKKWIQNTKYASVIQQNKEDSRGLGNEYTLNDTGQLETGQAILINLPDGYKVYIDGSYMGDTPILLESIDEGEKVLKIESKKEYIEQKILVKKEIEEIMTYVPLMKQYTGKFFVTTKPNGADIYIDDKKVGKSPFVLNKIIVGRHKVTIKKDGYLEHGSIVIIKKDDIKKTTVELVKGYKILFEQRLPKNTTIIISSSTKNQTYTNDEIILLEKGNWSVTVSNDQFKEQTFEVTIVDKDIVLDFTSENYSTRLQLQNLKDSSTVYINEKDITDETIKGLIELDVGDYILKVKTPGYEDFLKEITLENGKELEISVDYQIEKKKYYKTAMNILVPGVSIMATGLIMFPIGLGLNLGAAAIVSLYSDYVNTKYATIGVFAAGLFFTVAGIAVGCISIPFFMKYRGKTFKKIKKMSFNIEYNKDLRIGISLGL